MITSVKFGGCKAILNLAGPTIEIPGALVQGNEVWSTPARSVLFPITVHLTFGVGLESFKKYTGILAIAHENGAVHV